VAPDLRRLGSEATPTVRRLRPTLSLLGDVSKEATPGLEMLDRRAMTDILRFAQNWSLAMRGRDSLGHFVGAQVLVDPQTLTSAVNAYLGGTRKKGHKPSEKPTLDLPKAPPLPDLTPPKLPRLPDVQLPKVELPKPPLPDATKVSGAAGQQLPSQDSSALRLFDYLFGS
jgi:hypothetical protein